MKRSTNTAKLIKLDPQTAFRRRQLVSCVEATPDVTRVGEPDDMAVEFSVDGHAPLNSFFLTNVCENRFWTRHYNLVFETHLKMSERFEVSLKNGTFFGSSAELCRTLNESALIARLLSQVDLLSLTLTAENGVCRIRVCPLVGCIVKMLFPRLTYFIRPQAKEIAQCLQLLQLIFSQLSAV